MKLEDLKQHQTSRVAPFIMALVLVVILAASTAVSFIGYHYLQLSSEYREKSFTHLTAVTEALNTFSMALSTNPATITRTQELVKKARLQAFWCTNNLNRFETRLFEAIGAAPALTVCRSNAAIAGHALIMLERMKSFNGVTFGTPESRTFTREIRNLMRQMKRESLEFHPYVTEIEKKISKAVKAGTVITSSVLFVVLLWLLRNMVRLVKRQSDDNKQIYQAYARFTAAIEATTDGFALYDADKRLVAWNNLYNKLVNDNKAELSTGMTLTQVLETGIKAGVYSNVDSSLSDEFIRDHMARVDDPGDNSRLEMVGDRHVSVKVSHTKSGDSVIIRNDITPFVRSHQRQAAQAEELRQANAEIAHQSLHDPLTNLANRRYLDQELAIAMEQGPVCIIKIDLDHFKKVNDIFGHAAGDYVLKHVAAILTRNTRENDLPARIGGDEFTILCSPHTTMEQAERLGHRLLSEVLEPLHYNGKLCYFGASLGVAQSNLDTRGPSELLRYADAALYEAKSSGRGAVRLFTPNLQDRLERERRLGKDFVDALTQNEIIPFYQTQHEAGSRALCGVEALARWRHPELGLLTPDKFLGVVRQLGREADLDAAIFRRVLDDMKDLEAVGVELPRIAFNVSGGRVTDRGFQQSVRESLHLKRQRAAFEILESVPVQDLGDRFVESIDLLKRLGFEIEIDDFGSYHASITSILDLKPDGLKVDRSIIRPLSEDPRAERLISSIVEIGRALDITVTAEGVETARQAEMLEEIGCDKLQGYYFSRPMALTDLRDFILRKDQEVA